MGLEKSIKTISLCSSKLLVAGEVKYCDFHCETKDFG